LETATGPYWGSTSFLTKNPSSKGRRVSPRCHPNSPFRRTSFRSAGAPGVRGNGDEPAFAGSRVHSRAFRHRAYTAPGSLSLPGALLLSFTAQNIRFSRLSHGSRRNANAFQSRKVSTSVNFLPPTGARLRYARDHRNNVCAHWNIHSLLGLDTGEKAKVGRGCVDRCPGVLFNGAYAFLPVSPRILSLGNRALPEKSPGRGPGRSRCSFSHLGGEICGKENNFSLVFIELVEHLKRGVRPIFLGRKTLDCVERRFGPV
jgi:hypothetical protein